MVGPQIPPRGPFARSPESRLLEQELAKLKPGEFISYADLAKAAGLDAVEASTPPLVSARKAAQRNYGFVTSCVTGIGVFREEDLGIVDGVVPKGLASIRRKSKRVLTKANTVDFTALPLDAQKRLTTRTALLSATAVFSGGRAFEKLEAVAPTGQRQLPLSETLEIFKKK